MSLRTCPKCGFNQPSLTSKMPGTKPCVQCGHLFGNVQKAEPPADTEYTLASTDNEVENRPKPERIKKRKKKTSEKKAPVSAFHGLTPDAQRAYIKYGVAAGGLIIGCLVLSLLFTKGENSKPAGPAGQNKDQARNKAPRPAADQKPSPQKNGRPAQQVAQSVPKNQNVPIFKFGDELPNHPPVSVASARTKDPKSPFGYPAFDSTLVFKPKFWNVKCDPVKVPERPHSFLCVPDIDVQQVSVAGTNSNFIGVIGGPTPDRIGHWYQFDSSSSPYPQATIPLKDLDWVLSDNRTNLKSSVILNTNGTLLAYTTADKMRTRTIRIIDTNGDTVREIPHLFGPNMPDWNGFDFTDNDHIAMIRELHRTNSTLEVYSLQSGLFEKKFEFDSYYTELDITPDRKYIALVQEDKVVFLTSSTLELVGEIPFPKGLTGQPQISIAPSAKQFALRFHEDRYYTIVTFHLTNGETSHAFRTHAVSRTDGRKVPIRWCGDDYLLIDDEVLIDLKHEFPIWKYDSRILNSSRDNQGQVWQLVTNTPESPELENKSRKMIDVLPPTGFPPAMLIVHGDMLPHPRLLARLQECEKGLLLTRNTPVRVEIQSNADQETRDKLAEKFGQAIIDFGYNIDPDRAKIRMRLWIDDPLIDRLEYVSNSVPFNGYGMYIMGRLIVANEHNRIFLPPFKGTLRPKSERFSETPSPETPLPPFLPKNYRASSFDFVPNHGYRAPIFAFVDILPQGTKRPKDEVEVTKQVYEKFAKVEFEHRIQRDCPILDKEIVGIDGEGHWISFGEKSKLPIEGVFDP